MNSTPKKTPTGKKEAKKTPSQTPAVVSILMMVGFVILAIVSLPANSFQVIPDYTLQEPWRNDDLAADFTFAIRKTEQEITEERELIRRQNAPVFRVNDDASLLTENSFQETKDELSGVISLYENWQMAKEATPLTAVTDSLQYTAARENVSVPLSPTSWDLLLNQGLNAIPADLLTLIDQVEESGIIDIPKNAVEQQQLTLRNTRDRTQRTVSKANIRDLDEAVTHIGLLLSEQYSRERANLGQELLSGILFPNWIYSAEDTQLQLDNALSVLSETKGAIAQGQVIIRRGDIVTREKSTILESYADARTDRTTTTERWLRFSGDAVLVLIVISVFLYYLFVYFRESFLNPRWMGQILLTLGMFILLNRFIYSLEGVSEYVIPLAIAPILLTILTNDRIGILSAVILAIISGMIHGNSFEFATATFVAGYVGMLSARDLTNRNRFFVTAPILILAAYLVVTTGFALSRYSGWEALISQVGPIVINAILILITYPLILVFEKLFDNLTSFTLLELADTNHPLLKRLMDETPGTFHHSVQVARLAEGAAAAIGANPLLCRVGGLYHDIGKMDKPQFFIENQVAANQHDQIKPNLSRMVIRDHVKQGVEIAKEYKLHEQIIRFIVTHHGTSLIRYFYAKAQQQIDDKTSPESVTEKDYRYPGPKPATREEGILMLADTVEAASRSLPKQTPDKLKELTDKLFEDITEDQQLQECPLTYRDMGLIKASFLKTLSGIYHSRIEYPNGSSEKSV